MLLIFSTSFTLHGVHKNSPVTPPSDQQSGDNNNKKDPVAIDHHDNRTKQNSGDGLEDLFDRYIYLLWKFFKVLCLNSKLSKQIPNIFFCFLLNKLFKNVCTFKVLKKTVYVYIKKKTLNFILVLIYFSNLNLLS